MKMRMPKGGYCLVRFVPLHRRHGRGVYRRTTDWLAQAGHTIAWGRTRREAFANLIKMTGGGAKLIPFDRR